MRPGGFARATYPGAERELAVATLGGLFGCGHEVVDRPGGERRDRDARREPALLVPDRAAIERFSRIVDGRPEALVPERRRLRRERALVGVAQREAMVDPESDLHSASGGQRALVPLGSRAGVALSSSSPRYATATACARVCTPSFV